MREQFSCFYNDESNSYLKPIWESEKTLFIFDTNVLIDLYSFQPESREDFFKVLDKLRDKIWLPYHVGLEYQRRRLEIIKFRREHFTKINKELDDLQNALNFEQKKFTTLTTQLITKKSYPKLYEKINMVSVNFSKEVENLKIKLKQELDKLKEEIKDYDKDRIFLTTEDHIRHKIDEYFSIEKLGTCLFETQDDIDTLNIQGQERFDNKIPPGYEDESEKGESTFSFNGLTYKRKFGDLIIFNEMINIALLKKIENIIFISGDKKSDWRIIEKLEGDKILGARTELKMEMKLKANVDNFYIFQVEEFLNKTKEILDVEISDDSLTDIKKSSKETKLTINLSKENKGKLSNNIEKIKNKLYSEYKRVGIDITDYELLEESLNIIAKYKSSDLDDEDNLHQAIYQNIESRLVHNRKEQTYLEKLKFITQDHYNHNCYKDGQSEILRTEKEKLLSHLAELELILTEKKVSMLKRLTIEQEKKLLKDRLNMITKELGE